MLLEYSGSIKGKYLDITSEGSLNSKRKDKIMLYVAVLFLGRSILSDNASGSASTVGVNSDVELSI